jgi:hypothetical protein
MEVDGEYAACVGVLVIEFIKTPRKICVIISAGGVIAEVYDRVTEPLHSVTYTNFADAFPFAKYYFHLTVLLGLDLIKNLYGYILVGGI